MTIEEAFGTTLKKYRNLINMSQEELSSCSNLDRTFISLLERGKRKPTITTIFKLSSVLKISPSELVEEVERIYYGVENI